MKGFTPEKLENIITTLSTLYRSGAMEVSGESTIAGRNIMTAAFVIGGSNLLVEKMLDRISNDLNDFMRSNDERLNQLSNVLLGVLRCIEQGVRLSNSNAEAMLMRLNGIAEQISNAVQRNDVTKCAVPATPVAAGAIDPALQKILDDDKLATPMPDYLREQLKALRATTTSFGANA